MDEQQYEEEEYYEDYVPPSNKWLWIVLILAVVAAIVFGVLWYLRGGEVARLGAAMQSAQTTADANAQRLQTDLDRARADIAAGNTRLAEMESRLRDEQRRASETTQQVERRLRDEIDMHVSRLSTANSELETLRQQLAEAAEREKAATEGIAASTDARQRLQAVQAQLADALAAGAKARTLEEELTKARATIAELEGAVGDLKANSSHIGAELTTAYEDLAKAEADQKELAEVKERLAKTEADLAKAREEHAGQTRERERLSALASTHADQLKSAGALEQTLRASLAALETKYQAAQKELAEKPKAAESVAAELRERAAALESELEQAKKRADEAAKAADAAKAEAKKAMENAAAEAKKSSDSQAATLNDRLAEAGKTIARLEEKLGDIEANNSSLRKELTTASDDAREAATAKERLEKALNDAKQRADQAEKSLNDAKQATEKALREHEQKLREDFDRQKGEWHKQLEALQDAMIKAAGRTGKPGPDSERGETESVMSQPRQTQPRPTAEAAPAVRDGMEAAPSESVPGATPAPVVVAEGGAAPVARGVPMEEPRHVLLGDPGRSVGKVVRVMEDGLTYLVNGGSNQRVKPGMVFDVHRRFGGMNRYIGLLRVTRVLDDFSLAAPTYPSREARVCPVTGRVVLDPSRQASPYAEAEGGRPVPLISASSLGLGQDMPVVGDVIDNPYYDPNRGMVFAVGGDVAGDSRVGVLVAGLGGTVSDTVAYSDFVIVGTPDGGANVYARPRQVTVDALSAYVQ